MTRMFRWVLPLLLALLVATGIAPAAVATPNTTDPFYAPPADYAATSPGTILKVRRIDVSFFQALPMQVDGWQLLYRTTRADGSPYAAVTTVLKSRNAARPAAILSFQNMTDAVAPQCMPSQILQQGKVGWLDFSRPAAPVQLGTMANETVMVAAALARGWAVSVPDFGGIDNHFLTPREPGYVALDGVRAAERFAPAGLAGPGTPALFWGYSGGGIASGWAAEEQPTYAPELNVVGAALGAPVGDFEAGLRSGNGTPIGGALIPVALMGMVQESPQLEAALFRYVNPAGQQKIRDAMASCTPQNLLSNFGFEASKYLTAPLEQVFADPVVSAAVADAELGRKAPTAPLYVYNGIGDEISTIGGVDGLVSTYCRNGVPVTYRREQLPMPVSGHTLEWGLGAPGALAWLEQRAGGGAVTDGCDIRDVPATILAPEALNALGSGMILGSIHGLLGF